MSVFVHIARNHCTSCAYRRIQVYFQNCFVSQRFCFLHKVHRVFSLELGISDHLGFDLGLILALHLGLLCAPAGTT